MKKHVWWLLRVSLVFSLVRDTGQAFAARAPLTVAPYFTNSMVLQRDMKVPVWGTAAPLTPVTVSFQGRSVTTIAAPDGKWQVELPPMSASTTTTGGTLVVSGGGATIPPLKDVLVGDVWVLSGQSNINVRLQDCIGSQDAIAHSEDYRTIRLYLVPQTGSLTEQWEPSNRTNIPDWSGVGFFFARALQDLMFERGISNPPVPIGLIQVAKNGTPIADWTTYGGSNNGRLYKAKIKPLQPFAIRGVLWYQGEDDGGRESTALQYSAMLRNLIKNWRDDWGQGDFPFDYVQLAPIANRPTWAILRDAQVSTLDAFRDDITGKIDMNTAMACIIDVPTEPPSDIHPKEKEPVGERLARAALVQTYPPPPPPLPPTYPDLSNVIYSGPIRNVGESKILGSAIVVKFDFPYAGLVTDPPLNPTLNPPGPFLIAGPAGVYYPATATISGDSVVVSNPSAVPNPTSVRYCWGSYPSCNLFNDNDNDLSNGYGLPVSPFQLRLQ